MLYLFSTVLFCIVGLFTLGMHFVDVLEDRFPSFASYYHKIGVYGGHKLAVTEIMVLPIATQQDLVYTDSDSDSNMQKLLEITVLNRGTTAHLLAKIQVIMYTAEGQITKIAPIVAGFMMPPQRSRTIKAKVTIPATAASLSVVLDNRTVIKGYQLGRVPE